jgi:hypothetical protein
MRPAVFDRQPWWTRLKMKLIGVMLGGIPDALRFLWYRPEFYVRASMSGELDVVKGRHWSAGYRELFSTFTSRLNRCEF